MLICINCCQITKIDFWQSYKGRAADALALVGDEGRGYLR